jgi:hypothetical protein
LGRIHLGTGSRSRLNQAIAILSAVIMLLVTFQVMTCNVQAARPEGVGINSNWDPQKTVEGIYKGGITGAITGSFSGAISGGIIKPVNMRIGSEATPYLSGVKSLTKVFTNAKNAAYTPEDGIVAGDALMSPLTANRLAKVTTSSTLVAYGRAISTPIGLGVKEFFKSMYE